jgi:hypothetical protein
MGYFPPVIPDSSIHRGNLIVRINVVRINYGIVEKSGEKQKKV